MGVFGPGECSNYTSFNVVRVTSINKDVIYERNGKISVIVIALKFKEDVNHEDEVFLF